MASDIGTAAQRGCTPHLGAAQWSILDRTRRSALLTDWITVYRSQGVLGLSRSPRPALIVYKFSSVPNKLYPGLARSHPWPLRSGPQQAAVSHRRLQNFCRRRTCIYVIAFPILICVLIDICPCYFGPLVPASSAQGRVDPRPPCGFKPLQIRLWQFAPRAKYQNQQDAKLKQELFPVLHYSLNKPKINTFKGVFSRFYAEASLSDGCLRRHIPEWPEPWRTRLGRIRACERCRSGCSCRPSARS